MRCKSNAVDKYDQAHLQCGLSALEKTGVAGGEKQDIPFFFTHDAVPLSLTGLYRNSAAFLIAAGPSFSNIDKRKLDSVWTMSLNNAIVSYRSNANCIVDEPSRFSLSMWLDPTIQKFVPMAAFKKPLWDNRLLTSSGTKTQQWCPSSFRLSECPNVIGYRRNEKFDPSRFLYEETINWGCHAKFGGGRSVMLPALRILFLLGFRRVYLLGVDFDMTQDKRYHFDEERPPSAVRGNVETYAKLREWFSQLQPHFLKENFVVKNCNPQSHLTVFPFITIDEAVAEATGHLGDHHGERTVGMYKPIKEKRVHAARASSNSLQRHLPKSEVASEVNLLAPESENGIRSKVRNSYENHKGVKRKLILRNFQSPGDIVMLTAAVRDLHRSYPDQFETDVRTPCPGLWENNPFLTTLSKEDPSVEIIQCQYPLIHKSNTGPWHFIHGFVDFLNETLRLQIKVTDFKGDIHLARHEKAWISQVQETTREPVPYWIIVAGGKRDFTIKWWANERFQAVVDHFRERILFVQVGEAGHEHLPLRGVLDLRGKTTLRQLVRLVYRAQGVVCPVTLLMHLAAAVETQEGASNQRPCVVVAGGREPSQWEAYPLHQFIHTNGALFCCASGGCWKSRVAPLNDGDEKDKGENLCLNVISKDASEIKLPIGIPEVARPPADTSNEPKTALEYSPEQWERLLPKCMDLIHPEDVIRRIEMHFNGGSINYLKQREIIACKRTIPELAWSSQG